MCVWWCGRVGGIFGVGLSCFGGDIKYAWEKAGL